MVLAESTTGEDPIYYLHGLDLVAQSDTTTTEYFGYDGLGSVRQLTDEFGETLYTQTFDPYGNAYLSAGNPLTDFGYSGEQTDSNGLIFLRARYYDPGSGRFLNMDPSRQEVNPYAYVNGNPVMWVDLSGLWRFQASTDPFSGNMGQIIHDIIENYYMKDYIGNERVAHLEYGIPGSGVSHGRPKKPDILHSVTGEVWDIKPISSLENAEAASTTNWYIGLLNTADANRLLSSEHQEQRVVIPETYNWNRSEGNGVMNWQPGINFPTRVPVAKYVTETGARFIVFAGRARAGEIYYWTERYNEEYHRQIEGLTETRSFQTHEWQWERKQIGYMPVREIGMEEAYGTADGSWGITPNNITEPIRIPTNSPNCVPDVSTFPGDSSTFPSQSELYTPTYQTLESIGWTEEFVGP